METRDLGERQGKLLGYRVFSVWILQYPYTGLIIYNFTAGHSRHSLYYTDTELVQCINIRMYIQNYWRTYSKSAVFILTYRVLSIWTLQYPYEELKICNFTTGNSRYSLFLRILDSYNALIYVQTIYSRRNTRFFLPFHHIFPYFCTMRVSSLNIKDQISSICIEPVISARLNELTDMLDARQKALKKAPAGTLRISRSKNSLQYYHIISFKDKKGKYISVKNKALIQHLAQKFYDYKLVITLKKETKLLKEKIKKYTLF